MSSASGSRPYPSATRPVKRYYGPSRLFTRVLVIPCRFILTTPRTSGLRRCGRLSNGTPTYNPQSNSVKRTHRDLNTMLRVLCHQHSADWEEVLPAALLALRSAVHKSIGVTPFACVYGREPATPLEFVSKVPGAPLAAHNYVRRLEDHQFRAHRTVQIQLGRALQCTSRRHGDEKDAIQPGERVWLFTSKPAADRKLAIPNSGPWKVIKQLSGTLRTIRPEGDWCRQPRDITVSLNRLKRCYGEVRAPQQIDQDLRQLEEAEDNAEGPMGNTWITDEGAAATQALNQDAGDVHAPSLREKATSAVTPQPAPRLFSRHRDIEDMAPSIVVHHERASRSEPGPAGATSKSALKTDSTTMIVPEVSTPSSPGQDRHGTWPAPRTQKSFDQSAQVRSCSSQVVDTEEVTLPPVQEELIYDVFAPSSPAAARPAMLPSRPSSTTTAAPSSTLANAHSDSDTTTGADSGTEQRGIRRRRKVHKVRRGWMPLQTLPILRSIVLPAPGHPTTRSDPIDLTSLTAPRKKKSFPARADRDRRIVNTPLNIELLWRIDIVIRNVTSVDTGGKVNGCSERWNHSYEKGRTI